MKITQSRLKRAVSYQDTPKKIVGYAPAKPKIKVYCTIEGYTDCYVMASEGELINWSRRIKRANYEKPN